MIKEFRFQIKSKKNWIVCKVKIFRYLVQILGFKVNVSSHIKINTSVKTFGKRLNLTKKTKKQLRFMILSQKFLITCQNFVMKTVKILRLQEEILR